MREDKRRGIQSVEIAFRLLNCIEKSSAPQSPKEIAAAAGMTRSKAQFYLISLLKIGVVSRAPENGRYRLGAAALRLGLSALMHVDVLEMTRRAMSTLLGRVGHHVFLSVWGNHGPVVVFRQDGKEAYPFAIQVGTVLPILRSATGNICLAYLPRYATQKAIEREIAQSQRDAHSEQRYSWRTVNQLVANIKKRGVARREASVRGVAALAAPVFDYASTLRCIVTLLGEERKFRYSGRAAKELLRTADLISSQIGVPEKYRKAQSELT